VPDRTRTRTRARVAVAMVALAVAGCESAKPTSPTVGPSTPARVNYTLSGSVFETTPGGRAPIAGASVDVAVCPATGDTLARTVSDDTGHYVVSGVCTIPHTSYVWVTKPGYATNPRTPCDGDCLTVNADRPDTRFDVEVVRR
jgi:hypothetical protein